MFLLLEKKSFLNCSIFYLILNYAFIKYYIIFVIYNSVKSLIKHVFFFIFLLLSQTERKINIFFYFLNYNLKIMILCVQFFNYSIQ